MSVWFCCYALIVLDFSVSNLHHTIKTLFKAWSRSGYQFACFTICQKFCLSNFLPPGSFNYICFKPSSKTNLCSWEQQKKKREKERESTSARLVTIWIISCLDYCNSIFRTFYVWILSYYSCFDAGCRVLEDYMNDRVKYVITNSRWDDNFEEVSAVLMSQPSYCQC